MGHYLVVKNNEEAPRVLLCNDPQDLLVKQPNGGQNVENAPIVGVWYKGDVKTCWLAKA